MSRGRIDRDDVSLARLGILEGDNPFELADDMEENDLSSWEQRLRERENGLNERERRLDRRARELDGQRVQSPDDTSPSQNDRIVESLRNLWNEGYDDYDIVVEDIYDYLETVFGTRQEGGRTFFDEVRSNQAEVVRNRNRNMWTTETQNTWITLEEDNEDDIGW